VAKKTPAYYGPPGAAEPAWVAYDVEGAPLTLNELNRLRFDLMNWQEANPDAMPPELYSRLSNNIEWQMVGFSRTRKDKDQTRWHYVFMGVDHRGLGWDEAYEFASKALKGTEAAGSPRTMKESYQRFEKSLPPDKRRQRTYRPRN
jgi:hypothetical protein